MKKVYQTIVDKERGNCSQAAVASLLDMDIYKVPNFIEFVDIEGTNPLLEMQRFFKQEKGYKIGVFNRKTDEDFENLLKVAHYDGGINGYFYATVKSQTYENRFHAVVVDKDLNVVHDPNPNGKALRLNPEDVISILTTKRFVFTQEGVILSMDEYLERENKN